METLYIMLKKFTGKTILVLGSNVGATEIVQYAKENGAYTIVADYYPIERSEAKQIADEARLISTADSDALNRLIIEKKVNGVLAGISEFNLLKAMELSQRHGLLFYCNKIQWDSIENKGQFRKLCEKNGVPCPKTYYIGKEQQCCKLHQEIFPLIVKPVDCAASRGVYICSNEEQLRDGVTKAATCSNIGEVIVEEFVSGNEFTAHYTIANGKATLSCIDNRYPVAVHGGKVTTIPVARIYPSTYISDYIEKVNPSLVKLCENIGVKNGVVFVQGIHNPRSGQFWIFEGGLRSAAELPNRLICKINGINYMNNIVDYILLGKGTFPSEKDDPYMKGKCCGIISFVAKHGTVGTICGLEDAVAATPSVIGYESRYPVGSVTPDTDTLRQLMIRFVMICDSRELLAKDVTYLNEHITVLNDKGENMVIKLSSKRIIEDF
mgnify:CR=1 FL=1